VNADGYIVKPFKTPPLLSMIVPSMIEEQLEKQRKARKYSEQKVADYIESRAREQETEQTKT
jgi:response regulator RpfG family c-di-GMP phosphodiesterase